MRALALVIALAALLTRVSSWEFEGEYIRTKEMYKEDKECVKWDISVDRLGDRHSLPYIIPICLKWMPQENEDNVSDGPNLHHNLMHKTYMISQVYDLEVVKVKHHCLKWEALVQGKTIKPVCAKVQKRDVPEIQLIARDEDEKKRSEPPEPPAGDFVSTQTSYNEGQACVIWKVSVVKPGDKHTRPIVAPTCAEWDWQADEHVSNGPSLASMVRAMLIPTCRSTILL